MGGRGAGSSLKTLHPSGGGVHGGQYSKGLGFQNYDTLKDALGSKGKPISIKDSVEKANPHRDKSGEYKEFNENCQRCVVAYEARRRGYDVTAQPTYKGDTMPRTKNINGQEFGTWQGAFQNYKSENVSARKGKEVREKIESRMASYGNGARGVVSVQWKKGGGHVFNVEQTRSGLLYLDAQSGGKYDARELMAKIKTNDVHLARIDNLKFSDRAKKSITKDKW